MVMPISTKSPMNKSILDTLMGTGFTMITHNVNGICFVLEGKIVGIAHYRTMPRPIKGQIYWFSR